MWNMNYHAEHHLYTAVPWFNLPELRKHLDGHLKHKTEGGFLGANVEMYNEWIGKQAGKVPREDEGEEENVEADGEEQDGGDGAREGNQNDDNENDVDEKDDVDNRNGKKRVSTAEEKKRK
jgi:hypothetical protein